MIAQVPQLVLNYNSGSAEGISLAFLTVWLIGDIANLSGKHKSSQAFNPRHLFCSRSNLFMDF
jgi:hypothetical protein